MRDPLQGVPVQHKLTAMFVSVCLLAFGVGGYLVSSSAERALEREIGQRLEFQAQAYAAALDGELRMIRGRIQDFASDGFIRDHVERWQAVRDVGDEQASVLLEELREHLVRHKLPLVLAFEALLVADPDGLAFTGTDDAVSKADRDAAAACAAVDEPWFGSLTAGARDGRGPRFALGATLRARSDGRPIGHLIAWVATGPFLAGAMGDGETIAARVGAGEPDERPEPASLRLLDRGGGVLVVPATSAAVLARGPDSELARTSFGIRLESRDGPRTGEPSPRLAVYARRFPIASNGWTAEVELPSDAAHAAVSGLQSRFLAVGLILMAVASLLLYFPMRFLARPLRVLSATARRLESGDLEARAPVESSDEVGELARSFNRMAEAVQERTTRLVSTALDLEARRAELAAERDLLGAVIASMRDGLLVLDAEGHVVLHNDAARPLLEPPSDAASKLKSRHTCSERADVANCEVCLFGSSSPARSCVLDLGGGTYEVHSTQLARDARGRGGRVLVCRDLTDRIEKDERQIHQERLAVLGEVASVMAHELNNPLAAIRLYGQMLQSELAADSPLRENVDVIERNAVTCSRVVRELLDYATGASPHTAPVDLHALLEDVAAFVRPLRTRARVELQFDIGPESVDVTGDEVQLRQVFVNLVMNAIQVLPPGGQIVVRTRQSDEYVLIDVEDDGPGIAPENRDSVFRPFYTTKPRGQGTGLGLPTSRRIAEMHGGGVVLEESRPGKTIFRVRLRRRACANGSVEA